MDMNLLLSGLTFFCLLDDLLDPGCL
jgi:hypothetical protein